MREKILLVLSIVLLLVSIISVVFVSRGVGIRDKVLMDLIDIQKIDKREVESMKRDYLNKCLLARQVYQFSWWVSKETKIGKLYLEKQYAMNLYQYNQLINLSWDLNREIGVPIDSWQNYVMLAKWIMESGIWENAKHDTGEIVAFAGYTTEGLASALYVYKFYCHINEGSPLYVKAIFKAETKDDLLNAFANLYNVVRFDYGFIKYLLSTYNYQWDWVLTGFHFGFDKTDYWWRMGLKSIPEFRLDGKWSEEYMREYYQAIYEIAQGIALGQFERVSRYKRVLTSAKHFENANTKFIETLRLKVRSEQSFKELNRKYTELVTDFTNYRKLNEQLYGRIAELNDIVVDSDSKTMKQQIEGLKSEIRKMWKRIRKVK